MLLSADEITANSLVDESVGAAILAGRVPGGCADK
jgi:hypothetical protein